MVSRTAILVLCTAISASAFGCGSGKGSLGDSLASSAAAPANAPTKDAYTPTAAPPPPPPPPKPIAHADFGEADFVETDRNRDPFHAFMPEGTVGPTAIKQQHPVLLAEYGVDELRLAAIVVSGDYPRAMVVAPNGKGWILKRGDYVGKAEIVHTGGASGADYQLNWRVERVREGELRLAREDLAQPGMPPVVKVIPMHPEEDAKLEN